MPTNESMGSKFAGCLFQLIGLGLALTLVYFAPIWFSQTTRIGTEGTPEESIRLDKVFDQLTKQLEENGNIKRGGWLTFTESEINAYFQHKLNKSLNLKSFSVDIMKDRFKIRLVRSLLKLDLRFTVWEPMLSYDLVCMPKGKQLEVSKVSIGRIPVRGTFAEGLSQKIHAMLATQQEWVFIEKLTEMRIKDDSIAILITE